MLSVAIDRVTARYRLPPGGARHQARLARLLDDTLSRVLEGALERSGVGRSGHLCIREVLASVTVPLRESDLALAERLGDAIAVTVARTAGGALEVGDGPVVFYRTRAHALVDLASSALTGRFERGWAWAQMGIWPVDFRLPLSVAADRVARELVREPTMAVAVLAHLAATRQAAFAAMVRHVTPARWFELARAAINASCPDTRLAAASHQSATAAIDAMLWTIACRVAQQSVIARAASGVDHHLPPAIAQAMTALAILEVEPGVLHRGEDDARTLLIAVEAALATTYNAESDPDGPRGGSGRAGTDQTGDFDTPARAASLPSTSSVTDALRSLPSTAAGGLLYLINLASRIGLPATLLNDTRLSARGLRWTLHQLAMDLAQVAADDPAALAFAGAAPDAPPPSSVQPPASEVERNAIREHRDACVRGLRVDLAWTDTSDAALLAFVCQRRARIAADPGWFDVHLSLDDVSVEIRRAGLDLDPGWVPWLGVVVRFVYA